MTRFFLNEPCLGLAAKGHLLEGWAWTVSTTPSETLEGKSVQTSEVNGLCIKSWLCKFLGCSEGT